MAQQQFAGSSQHGPRGVATLLVMIAVAMAFILSLSFLSAQSTTMGITENIGRHVRARAIAESGLQMTIIEVQQNIDWRTDFANGTWVTNHSFGGGTFTISGVDGEDTDGDGVISVPAEGDGDLSDDTEDRTTLTVTGTFQGVTHQVQAVVTLSTTVSIQQITVSDKVEIKDTGVIDSWDSSQGSYAATKGSAAIVATNSVSKDKIEVDDSGIIKGDAYVGSGGNTSTGIKLKGSGQITGIQDVLESKHPDSRRDGAVFGGKRRRCDLFQRHDDAEHGYALRQVQDQERGRIAG